MNILLKTKLHISATGIYMEAAHWLVARMTRKRGSEAPPEDKDGSSQVQPLGCVAHYL